MDGRNCTGRKISLLNDSSDGETTSVPTKIQLPPLTAHSRTSSCSSTPSLSPQTPHLTRSSSSDSRVLASPSPLTPSFHSFDPHQQYQHQRRNQQYYISHPQHQQHAKMDDQNVSMYPPIPDGTGALNPIYPMPQQQMHALPLAQIQVPQQLQAQSAQSQQQQHASLQRSSTSPRSEPSRASNASAASNPKQPQKKNQYPCPMAKQVGCNDYFTTSGHAARHAKKHTGKKDAFCPECNKAFTRKDNMEQHRRTHQNGRGAARSTDDKVKKASKHAAKKNSITKSDAQLEAAVEQQLAEQQLPTDPISTMAMPQPLSQTQSQIPLQATLAPGLSQQAAEQAMMMPSSTPYFLNSIIDPGPIPALPLVPEHSLRPPLHRANFTNSLEYIPPIAPALLGGDDLHYSYPSPGLSNGLNSLALAASEHRRMSEEKNRGDSPKSTPNETPDKETP